MIDAPADVVRGAVESGLPVSAKAIVIADGQVLLVRNHRDEWELPGGRPDRGESLAETVAREVREATGLAVSVGGYVDWWDYPIDVEAVTVRVISFVAGLSGPAGVTMSDEHTEIAWHPLTTVPDLAMPAGYKRSIAQAATLT